MTDDLLPDAASDALQERAERGRPRGADAVLGAARTGSTTPDLGAATASPDRRRLATAAAAVLVVAAIGGGALALRARSDDSGGDPGSGARGSVWCDVLAAPEDGAAADHDHDLQVYVEPGPASARAAVGAVLDGDPRVASVTYIDVDATYANFRDLFADEPALLDNVEPEELPTSFQVDLVDPATAGQVMADLRSQPEVYEVRQLVALRVLDLLVWPGHDDQVRSQGGSPDFGVRTYGPTWPEQLAAAQVAASAEVAAAVRVLGESLVRETGRTGARPDPAAEAAAVVRAGEAARNVERSAATDCGLTPIDLVLQPHVGGESDTIEASSGTTAPGSATSTTTARGGD